MLVGWWLMAFGHGLDFVLPKARRVARHDFFGDQKGGFIICGFFLLGPPFQGMCITPVYHPSCMNDSTITHVINPSSIQIH